jgi:CARDB
MRDEGPMREPDTDFEFDFFEEPSTQETTVQRRTLRRRGGPRRPVRPPPGLTPLLRLVGLVAFAILAVVVLVFVVQGCRDKSKTAEYRGYMDGVSQLARESDAIGADLNKLLTTPGTKEAELESKLSGLAQRQQQLVVNAEALDSPGRLVGENRGVIESFQFRVSGLRGLEDAFRATAKTKNATRAGRLLSAQALRLVASDVVWDDVFKDPARQELRAQGIGGVRVPDSSFVANVDLVNPRVMRQIWQQLRGAQTGGGTPAGLHGNGIVSTKVLPAGTELSESTETTIQASTQLAFQVTVENSGQFQEVGVEVTLTIRRANRSPLTQTRRIDVIEAGEQKTVTFRDLGQPPFDEPTQVKVDVKPVRGEQNTTNNTAEYPVLFSFAG